MSPIYPSAPTGGLSRSRAQLDGMYVSLFPNGDVGLEMGWQGSQMDVFWVRSLMDGRDDAG